MNAMVRAGDIANSLEEIQRVGRMLAMTGYFAAKGDTPQAIAQIATQILAGREMGYGPFASVQGIHIIQGKPTLSANLMASAVKNSPRYDYRVREISEKVCRIEFFEYVDGKRESLGISEFTLEQAQKAGVKNLDKYARNMLFARAMSNGVRWFCPDVFAGNAVYVPEELGAEVDGEGDVIEVTGVHIDDAPAIDKNGPTATQSAQTSQHTTPDAKTPQTPQERTNGRTTPNHTAQRKTATQRPTAQRTAHMDSAPEVNPDGPDNLFETVTPTDEELEILGAWRDTADAFAWAIEIGACDNEFEARNSLKNLINDEFGGKFTKANAGAVYVAYMRKQLKKLAERKEAA